MKTALFLGAGASVFVNQPTTKELLDRVRDKYSSRSDLYGGSREPVLDILTNCGLDDVEQVYSCIDAICDLQRYVSKPIRDKIHYKLGNYTNYMALSTGLSTLRSAIRDVLVESFQIEGSVVRDIAQVYNKLWLFITNTGSDKFQIITTNYDLVIENYCGHAKRECINGFTKHSSPPKGIWTDNWSQTTTHPIDLIKLHGSINWQKEDNEENNIIELGASGHRNINSDVMIVPTLGGKKYHSAPFSNLMHRFEDTLKNIDMLIVIGFSYRDEEINKIIGELTKKNLVLISISPTSDEDIRHITSESTILNKEQPIRHPAKLKPKIYVYKTEFGPDTIDDIYKVLNNVYRSLMVI